MFFYHFSFTFIISKEFLYLKPGYKRAFHNQSFNTGFDLFMGQPLTSVDYPPCNEVGEGKKDYIYAMRHNINSIVFYYGFFILANATPFSINRLSLSYNARKKHAQRKRTVFYISHYCTITKLGRSYKVQLFWPVFMGGKKGPKKILTCPMPA